MKPIYPPEEFGAVVNVAANQEEYQTLPSRIDAQGAVTTLWEFTPEERAAIADGKNLYFELLTFNRGLQPMMPWVEGFERE